MHHNKDNNLDRDVRQGIPTSNAATIVSPEPDETETSVSLVLSSRGRGCKGCKKNKAYRVETRTRRLNDLMFLIGWLEFFNALDFPANVFNQRPVPAYAIALMVTGGVLILMASCVAFLDMIKGWHNLKLLRRERVHLLAELKEAESIRGDEEALLRTLHLKAWVWVNRGELGWELIDRAMMDCIGGFGGLLVGIGTLMAPAGANRRVFDASNLLSGYVGNGFVAFYGLINAGWAAYLFWQGSQRWAAVEEHLKDPLILKRARRCFWHHQVYAAVYGVTVIVASVGSLASATMWYGYVILIPCIATSVFGNILWRRRVGYNRVIFPFKPMLCPNIMGEIACVIRVQTQIREGHHGAVLAPFSRSQLLAFIREHDMFEDLCLELARDPSLAKTLLRGAPERIRWDESVLLAIEYGILLRAAETCLAKVGLRRTIDRERLLYELLGCYHVVERDMFKAPARSATEKSLLSRLTPGQSSLSVGHGGINE
ncbi:uncharacterized protein PG986_011514 [Apiospora aurea]|uniref:Integral membrane protein n=1 Tax=Apiospora aurea TaxID=335848 RepID=A0ABR1PXE8_9PEZI